MSSGIEAREGRYLKGRQQPRSRIFGAIKEAAFFTRYPETMAQLLRVGKGKLQSQRALQPVGAGWEYTVQ